MDSNQKSEKNIKFFCNSMIGKEVWGAVAGKGAGSGLSLDIGAKIPRQKKLTNPHLSDDVKNFNSEWGLYIQNCSWRLHNNSRIICTSNTDNVVDMPKAVQILINKNILNISISDITFDLTIEFTDGIYLSVFSDCFYQDDGDNYSLFSPNMTMTVGPSSTLLFQPN